MHIVLDSGPLGLLSNPASVGDPSEIRGWALHLLDRGETLVVPEIADYEVRRELIRAGKTDGVRRLDELAAGLDYLPLTTSQIRRAAQLWSDVRNRGRPPPLAWRRTAT